MSATLGAQNIAEGGKLSAPRVDSVRQEDYLGRNTRVVDSLRSRAEQRRDSLLHTSGQRSIDSLLVLPSDTAGRRKQRNFLDEIINGKNKDSLYYDVRGKMVHIYEQGDVTYGNMNIKADYMRVSMDSKEILAYGKADTSAYGHTRPDRKSVV